MALQAGLHIGHPAGGDHTGVADHQHLARTEGLGVIADVVPAAGTKDDFRRDEFTQEAEILAHWKPVVIILEYALTLKHPRECNQTKVIPRRPRPARGWPG
jgi:hypothetical protein